MSHNQNNDIMKPTDYIEWDNLKNIPFFLCQVVEDKENKDIDIYYLGKRVFHDYDHVGHYMRSAIILFRRIKNRTAGKARRTWKPGLPIYGGVPGSSGSPFLNALSPHTGGSATPCV